IIAAQSRSGLWNVFPHPLGCAAFLLCVQAIRGEDDPPASPAERDAIAPAESTLPALRRAFPAAFATGRAMQRLLAGYLVVVVYLGGWHAWVIATDPEAAGGWSGWILAIVALHTKVVA